ncbi:MAG: V-type ATPase subunit [Candidatus Ranarchaeia archaeon]
MLPLVFVLILTVLFISLFALISKAQGYGYLAFIAPQILYIESRIHTTAIRSALNEENLTVIRELLLTSNWISGPLATGIPALIATENSLKRQYEDLHQSLMAYLSNELRQFFTASRIFWDIENLSVLVRALEYKWNDMLIEQMLGPTGYVDAAALQQLKECPDKLLLLDTANKHLPIDFINHLRIYYEQSPVEVEFELLKTGVTFLKSIAKSLASVQVNYAWSCIAKEFEIRNLKTIFRLKKEGMHPKLISTWLLPVTQQISETYMQRILNAESVAEAYAITYEVLTGKRLPRQENEVTLAEITDFLDSYLDKDDQGLYAELSLESLISMLTRVERGFRLIRQAVFLLHFGKGGSFN